MRAAGGWWPAVWGLLLAAPVAAQGLPASPPLPADHWAVDALERLAGEGLVGGAWMPGARPVPEAVAAAALDTAAARAARTGSPLSGFASAAADRLRRELGGGATALPAPWAMVAAASRGGVATAAVGARLRASPHRSVSVMLRPEARLAEAAGPAAEVGAASVLWAPGAIQVGFVRAGRRLGPGVSGGLLLDDGAVLDAAVVGTTGPVRLPGFLAALGPADAVLTVARVEAVTVDTAGTDPWLVTGRLALEPHPRVRIGINRVITTLTEWHGERPGPREVLYMAIGKHTVFDDQKASVELALRVSPFGLHVTTYGELGFEDSAGALLDDPGLLAGVFLPRLPGAPGVSMRWEYAAFGDGACFAPDCGSRTTSWFHHPLSRRLHADPDGTPLGHPLGGYGSQHRLQLAAWLGDATVRAGVTGLAVERHPGNLLFDGSRETEYRGGVTLDWWPAPGWELGVLAWSGATPTYRLHLAVRPRGW